MQSIVMETTLAMLEINNRQTYMHSHKCRTPLTHTMPINTHLHMLRFPLRLPTQNMTH